ncbi:DUF1330 domain-containing protein [Pyruvatibacter sp.]|uniref:DUF1330 domain-containing protein n=1 Tax=Pyruvatibacter sp. TaxID=1981328 RepID=UPI003264C41B
MTAFVVWEATIPDMGKLQAYAEKVGATLDAYGGRYLVRLGETDLREGSLGEHAGRVILEFPDMETARAWYTSDMYQAIVALRTDNASGNLYFMQGV